MRWKFHWTNTSFICSGRESDYADASPSNPRRVTTVSATNINQDGFTEASQLEFTMKNRGKVPKEIQIEPKDKQSCTIIVVGPIDRDRLDPVSYPNSKITILVEAKPVDDPSISATLKVVLEIEDSNDEEPIFEEKSLKGSLNEEANPDSKPQKEGGGVRRRCWS